eukprot:GHVU01064788.1.p1 GENE.GHVU01064788.1~~GHVU01064788.1.p1  ORF type:complete len:318 (+),score=45.16 GHVU01064788.1:3669-4622(+)
MLLLPTGSMPGVSDGMDRVNNNAPYCRGTVVPCCWPCNRAKGILDGVEFYKGIQAIWYFKRWKRFNGDLSRPVSCRAPKEILAHIMSSTAVKERGRVVELDEAAIKKIVEKDCKYCGRPDAGSVDREDSLLGYTKQNVVPSCACCNYIKGAVALGAFYKMVDAVHEHITQEKLSTFPVRSGPVRKLITISHPRVVDHKPTAEEMERFVGFPGEVPDYCFPTVVDGPTSSTNVLAGCGGIKIFDLPLFISFIRGVEGLSGDEFLISKLEWDAEEGGYVDVIGQFTTSSRTVPTFVKVLHALSIYNKEFFGGLYQSDSC